MLENAGLLGGIILYYSFPLILAFIFIKIFRNFVSQDTLNRDFFCGLIFLQATREIFRSFRRGINRRR